MNILNMNGPEFLAFYSIVTLITVVLCLILNRTEKVRLWALGIGFFVVNSLGFLKLMVALSQEHYNVGFLIMIALIGNIALLSFVTSEERGATYKQGSRHSSFAPKSASAIFWWGSADADNYRSGGNDSSYSSSGFFSSCASSGGGGSCGAGCSSCGGGCGGCGG